MFENPSHPVDRLEECSSIGMGCAAAFFFNYARLIAPLLGNITHIWYFLLIIKCSMFREHQRRMQFIQAKLREENRLDYDTKKTLFIDKWVFVIPWTIENCSQLLSYGVNLIESEQEELGFKLSVWTPA
jgi:hypothetical protein